MNIAIIKDGVCVDAAAFEDIETAEQFLDSGVWPEADGIAVLPEGFGIGDGYIGGEWIKKEVPPPPAPPEPPTPTDITELQEALRILTGGADDELDW